MSISGDKLNTEDIESLLTGNSKIIIDTFLTFYNKNSHASLRSSIYRTLYYGLSKDNVLKINIQDYKKLFPDETKKLLTQEIYRLNFLKFLYAFDHLDNPDGFETIWIKDTIKRQFSKVNDQEVTVKTAKRRRTLNIEELLAIQGIFEANSTKFNTLKMHFCWYAIFDLGLEIEDVRNTTYEIPEKFFAMFNVLSQQDRVNNGFASLDVIIGNLGQLAKIDKKLLPSTIKQTRKVYMITCGHCGEEQPNLSSKWLSVNDRIVCVDCADDLKKRL